MKNNLLNYVKQIAIAFLTGKVNLKQINIIFQLKTDKYLCNVVNRMYEIADTLNF